MVSSLYSALLTLA